MPQREAMCPIGTSVWSSSRTFARRTDWISSRIVFPVAARKRFSARRRETGISARMSAAEIPVAASRRMRSTARATAGSLRTRARDDWRRTSRVGAKVRCVALSFGFAMSSARRSAARRPPPRKSCSMDDSVGSQSSQCISSLSTLTIVKSAGHVQSSCLQASAT